MRQFRVCDSVEAYGLEKALDKACIDLDRVDKMSDTEACAFCNTDTKEVQRCSRRHFGILHASYALRADRNTLSGQAKEVV